MGFREEKGMSPIIDISKKVRASFSKFDPFFYKFGAPIFFEVGLDKEQFL